MGLIVTKIWDSCQYPPILLHKVTSNKGHHTHTFLESRWEKTGPKGSRANQRTSRYGSNQH